MDQRSATFLAQIDGLRTFAVTAVLVHHFWSPGILGTLGVRLFFVISGFLITGILLRARDRVDRGESVPAAFRRFYARRALRILPAYYAVLAAAWLYGIDEVRATIWWHAAHVSNVLVAVRGEWGRYTAHLWTLGIEEQFYLAWPWLVLLLPARRLVPVVVGLILCGIAFRFMVALAGHGALVMYVLTPSQFDALGAGALLAILRHRGIRVAAVPAAHVAAAAGLAASVALVAAWPKGAPPEYEALFLAASVVPTAWLVLIASLDRAGGARILLANPAALYLGKVSYGIYLFHLFVEGAVQKLVGQAGLPLPPRGPLNFLICAAATVAVAALSWRFFEGPLNALKRRF